MRLVVVLMMMMMMMIMMMMIIITRSLSLFQKPSACPKYLLSSILDFLFACLAALTYSFVHRHPCLFGSMSARR